MLDIKILTLLLSEGFVIKKNEFSTHGRFGESGMQESDTYARMAVCIYLLIISTHKCEKTPIN